MGRHNEKRSPLKPSLSIEDILAKRGYDEEIPLSEGLRIVEDPETFKSFVYNPKNMKMIFGGGFIEIEYLGTMGGKHIARVHNLEEYNEEENAVAIVDEEGKFLFGGWNSAYLPYELPALNPVNSNLGESQLIFSDNQYVTTDFSHLMRNRLPSPNTLGELARAFEKSRLEPAELEYESPQRRVKDCDLLVITKTDVSDRDDSSLSIVNESGEVLMANAPFYKNDLMAKQVRFFSEKGMKKIEIKYGSRYSHIFDVSYGEIHDIDIQKSRKEFVGLLQNRSENID